MHSISDTYIYTCIIHMYTFGYLNYLYIYCMRAPVMKILHTCKTLYIALHYTHYIIYIKIRYKTLRGITLKLHTVIYIYIYVYITLQYNAIYIQYTFNIHSIYIQYTTYNIQHTRYNIQYTKHNIRYDILYKIQYNIQYSIQLHYTIQKTK